MKAIQELNASGKREGTDLLSNKDEPGCSQGTHFNFFGYLEVKSFVQTHHSWLVSHLIHFVVSCQETRLFSSDKSSLFT